MFESKKPRKNERLTIISHMGSYYATIDNQHLYEIDPLAVGIIKMCDGKKKYEDILAELSEKTGFSIETIKPILDEIFKELTEFNFIIWEEAKK
jgi:hypothetical protein